MLSKKLYYKPLASVNLQSHLADKEQAQNCLLALTAKLAAKGGIIEQFEATNHIKWVQKMNNIREYSIETFYSKVMCV